jgi:6-phosphogluconolactonase (cycloisomerase 2 family)
MRLGHVPPMLLAVSGPVLLLCLGGCGAGPSPTTVGGNPIPAISMISPANDVAGSPAFTMTVYGTNFMPSSIVNFGGTPEMTTIIDTTQLSAAIPSAATNSTGTVTVTVTNPAPGGGTSNAASFVINGGTNPTPVISSLDPTCAPVGAQSFKLWVTGTNFVPTSVVRWNGAPLSTTFGGNSLFAQVPASNVSATGTASISVFSPAPGGGISNSSSFAISAGGVGPTGMAVDPTGTFAYVADEGCPDAFAGSVSMYSIDQTNGALTPVGPPVNSGDFGAIALAVDPSGKFAYVANWGEGNTGGSVSIFAINQSTGALTSSGSVAAPCSPPPATGACSPRSLAIHPSGKFLYVANEGGFTPTGVSVYAIDATSGGLTLIGVVSADGRATVVAVDPSGKFAYVADGEGNSDGSPGVNVAMYTIDATTGVLTSTGTVIAGVSPISIAIHPSGKFAYVGISQSLSLSIYSIDFSTGKLTLTGSLPGVAGLLIHPSGKFGYADGSIYAIDAITGALTLVGTSGAGSNPNPIIVHPSGKFAYGISTGTNSVFVYRVDPNTGFLTLIGSIGT